MPVANIERCDYVDPNTGKRCGARATYFGDGKFCEGRGHDPAYYGEEEQTPEPVGLPVSQPVSASTACQCGCGLSVKEGRSYKQGHDQRHKGNLIRRAKAGSTAAGELLIKKGWKTPSEINELILGSE